MIKCQPIKPDGIVRKPVKIKVIPPFQKVSCPLFKRSPEPIWDDTIPYYYDGRPRSRRIPTRINYFA